MADLVEPIREELRAQAEAFTPSSDLHAQIERRAARRQRVRVATSVAAAVVVLILAAGGGFLALGRHSGSRSEVVVGGQIPAGVWSELPTSPLSPRDGQYTIWTGDEMIVWGGSDFNVDPINGPRGAGQFDDGAAYDPIAGTWRSVAQAPQRLQHTDDAGSPLESPAVWTGQEMLVFGADADSRRSGGLGYNPRSDRWRELAAPPAGLSLNRPSVVWTGTKALVYGGALLQLDDGGSSVPNLPGGVASYDPKSDTWTTLAAFPLTPRNSASVTWTDREMIVWGGADPAAVGALGDGAAYDPSSDSWRVLPASPIAGRRDHGVAWTGHELIVWGGGVNGGVMSVADGAAYDPRSNTWRTLSAAPLDASQPAAMVWTGQRVLVIGGVARAVVAGNSVPDTFVGGAASYDPTTDTWSALPAPPPVACSGQTSVWTGSTIFLWGGRAECPTSHAVPATNVGLALRP